jgi:uncharacterized protein YkwD
MTGPGARKALILALLMAIPAVGALAPAAAGAAESSCPSANTNVAQIPLGDFDNSVLCVLNERRAEYGLAPLTSNSLLRDAAWIYATSMLSGQFYGHQGCLDGRNRCSTPIGRLRLLGYIRPGWAWVVGENLRGAYPETSTPSAVVQAWMESPVHRVEVLKARFREVGVASVRGLTNGFPYTEGVTVAAEFGFRKKRKEQGRR